MTLPSHLGDPSYGLGGWHIHDIPLSTLVEQHSQEAVAYKCAWLKTVIAKKGLSKEIIKEICDGATMAAQGASTKVYYSARFKGFVTDEWHDIEDLIESYGNSTAQWALKVLNGSEDGFDFYDVAKDSAKDFLEGLQPQGTSKNKRAVASAKSYQEAWDYLRLNVGTEKIAEALNIIEVGIGGREIFDESEIEQYSLYEIVDALKESGGDETLWDAAMRAAETGMRYGAEKEMHDDLIKALNNPDDEVPGTLVTFTKDQWWDDRSKRDAKGNITKRIPHIFHVLSADEILDAMAEGISEDFISPWLSYERNRRDSRNWINLHEPQNGWNDFDWDAAHDFFQEEIPAPPANPGGAQPTVE
jgi:hypothetical protein